MNYICLIHHSLLSLFFFYHSSCRRDHSTVLILKFGIEDFTDPGLPKIRMSFTGLSLWFCLHKCFRYNLGTPSKDQTWNPTPQQRKNQYTLPPSDGTYLSSPYVEVPPGESRSKKVTRKPLGGSRETGRWRCLQVVFPV